MKESNFKRDSVGVKGQITGVKFQFFLPIIMVPNPAKVPIISTGAIPTHSRYKIAEHVKTAVVKMT